MEGCYRFCRSRLFLFQRFIKKTAKQRFLYRAGEWKARFARRSGRPLEQRLCASLLTQPNPFTRVQFPDSFFYERVNGKLALLAGQAGRSSKGSARRCLRNRTLLLGFNSLIHSFHKKMPVKGHFFMERVKGIEPSYSAWEAAALPLSYTRNFFIFQ